MICAPSWSFQCDDALNAPSVRESFRLSLCTQCWDAETLLISELILGELLANVVLHAPGPIRMWIECAGSDCTLHVLDCGGKRLNAIPSSPPHWENEHGRGLHLIRSLAKDIHITQDEPFGTHVSVALPVRLGEH